MRVRLMDRELEVPCAPGQERRIFDLVTALKTKMSPNAEVDELIRVALALLNEAQTARAALERARLEIERLTDLAVESRIATGELAAENGLVTVQSPRFAAQGSA